mgnify:FL=1
MPLKKVGDKWKWGSRMKPTTKKKAMAIRDAAYANGYRKKKR